MQVEMELSAETARQIVARITHGVSGYRTPPKVLWVGKHLALVKFCGSTSHNRGAYYTPGKIALVTIDDGGRGGYSPASVHQSVWTVTRTPGVDPRYGRADRVNTGPISKAVLAALIASAEREDSAYPAFREQRLAEIAANEAERDAAAAKATAARKAEQHRLASQPLTYDEIKLLAEAMSQYVENCDEDSVPPLAERLVERLTAAMLDALGE